MSCLQEQFIVSKNNSAKVILGNLEEDNHFYI